MGIWIRSQNKKELVYTVSFYTSYLYQKHEIRGLSLADDVENPSILGEYKTEEECIEVINEIQATILRGDKMFFMPEQKEDS